MCSRVGTNDDAWHPEHSTLHAGLTAPGGGVDNGDAQHGVGGLLQGRGLNPAVTCLPSCGRNAARCRCQAAIAGGGWHTCLGPPCGASQVAHPCHCSLRAGSRYGLSGNRYDADDHHDNDPSGGTDEHGLGTPSPPSSPPSPFPHRQHCEDMAAHDVPWTREHGRREEADDADEDITTGAAMTFTDDVGARPRRCRSHDDAGDARGRCDDDVLMTRCPCRDPRPSDPSDGGRVRAMRQGAALVRRGRSSSARKMKLDRFTDTGTVSSNMSHSARRHISRVRSEIPEKDSPTFLQARQEQLHSSSPQSRQQ